MAGHRARFVPPVRLYIFASFIMFLLLNLGGGVTVSDVEVSNSGSTAVDSPSAESVSSSEAGENSGERSWPDRFADRLTRGLQRLAESPQSFGGDILNRLAQAMFFLLPAVALLLKLVHRRRLYVHHLVFAVYLHSFAFLVVALVAVPDAVGLTEPGRFMAIALLGIPPYALLAMKRFYGESWWKTVAKFSFVSLAYSLLGIATAGAVLLLTVLSA